MSVLSHILKALDADRNEEIVKNGGGGAQDWGDYKRRVGKIQGLEAAINRINELKRELHKTGDLDGDE